jgi:opacity protein-like surface antigen
MRRTVPATAALMALTAGAMQARAADLASSPFYQPEPSSIVELGTGWYLRADANVYDASFNSAFGALSETNFGATLGAGYQFTPFFRVDATFDYMTPVSKTKTSVLAGAGLAYSLPGVMFGTLYPPGCPVAVDKTIAGNVYSVSCTANPWAKVTENAYLLNAYFDLGHWYGLTPYIGAGAGVAYIHSQGNITYRFINGVAYGDGNSFCGGNTGIAGVPCFHLGYPNNAGVNVASINFAYALMAGFSYDLSNLVKFDIGYRYLDMGPKINAQEFRAGVRITPDG